MTRTSDRKRIWGWYFFDWASQPFNTLLLTFIFGPYIHEVLSDGVAAQAAWGYTVGAAGICIALLAPFLGALADRSGNRISWIWLFSFLYVIGASAVWLAEPSGQYLITSLFLFGLGIVGMEFATIFTNSMLPDLAPRDEIGGLSGSGWAFGYVGGLIALVLTLFFLAEDSTGVTLLGNPPVLGLDPETREGTRSVGPFTALWYAVFMVPFFLWVKERPGRTTVPMRLAAKEAWPDLMKTVRNLPQTPSLFAFLGSSMLYRDALNGFYVFGGLYAAGVLGWNVVQTGVFGILAVIAGAVFAWLGGKADNRFGPKPVIITCVLVLTSVCLSAVLISRESIFGFSLAPGSVAPDIAFYIMGTFIGAAGGALQSASRSMMCRQSDEDHMTQAFGLYALAGKATSFVAPISIGLVTELSGSQQIGIAPLIVLFLLGLLLLRWVKPDGERAVCPSSGRPSPQV